MNDWILVLHLNSKMKIINIKGENKNEKRFCYDYCRYKYFLYTTITGCQKSTDAYKAGVYTALERGYVDNIEVEVEFSKNEFLSIEILFDDTIRSNILMGNLNASDMEVERAAKEIGCHDFIMGLKYGYETRCGGGGGHISGGERQRIAIARALLKDAPIVILDEATAYINKETS